MQIYKSDEKMNFNPISSAFLDLNSKELTVGFQRIPGSHVFILGNEKGQIFQVGFDREKMKFLEMLLFFIIFNIFHVFIERIYLIQPLQVSPK